MLAQESDRPVGDEVDLEAALRDGNARVAGGDYDLVMHVGARDGWPMLTFTRAAPIETITPAAPSPAYAATMVGGLRQSHDLSERAATAYIARHAPSRSVSTRSRADASSPIAPVAGHVGSRP